MAVPGQLGDQAVDTEACDQNSIIFVGFEFLFNLGVIKYSLGAAGDIVLVVDATWSRVRRGSVGINLN
jgi:hypothetical protein